MKKLLLLIVILFSVSYSFAQEEQLSEKEKARREKNIQAGNPFARFGYKAKVATLSKGKYLEFHDLDSIVKIGSFSYHVKRKVITGFTKYDTVYPESTLRPEIVSRWLSPDPLSEEFPSWSPYNFTLNNPIRFIDPDGLAPEDIIINGKNGSSLTIVTDLVDISVNAGWLVGDLGGNYSFGGDDILEVGLDIGGIVDQTGIIDGIATGYYGKKGQYWSALGSFFSIAPGGDVVKLAKTKKHLKTINKAIDAIKQSKITKQKRMAEIAADPKQSSYIRGWFKNEKRHIKFGNKKTMRNPGNGRKSPGRKKADKGLELAHPSNSPASKGNDFNGAKYKNHGEHKVETRIHRKKYQ